MGSWRRRCPDVGGLGRCSPAPALDPAKVNGLRRGFVRLADRCEKCHSAAAGKSKGRPHAGYPGRLGEGRTERACPLYRASLTKSLLLKAIGYTDPDLRMPPKKEGGPLKEDEVAAVRRWISEGAGGSADGNEAGPHRDVSEAKAHWAFQPVPRAAGGSGYGLGSERSGPIPFSRSSRRPG